MNSENFPRIRIGAGQDVSLQLRDYVLKRPGKDEQAILAEAYEKAADAVIENNKEIADAVEALISAVTE